MKLASFLKHLKNQAGFTFMEVMATAAILGVVSYSFIGSNKFLSQSNKDINSKLSVERAALSLYRSIQTNTGAFQVTNRPADFYKMINVNELYDTLPIAWNETGVYDVSECPHCLGRMGYALAPMLQYRGLYTLTIRITHKKLIDGFKDYIFVIHGD
jgi:prepilin-type N-terminal cleavage/methylation domain-containing protein